MNAHKWEVLALRCMEYFVQGLWGVRAHNFIIIIIHEYRIGLYSANWTSLWKIKITSLGQFLVSTNVHVAMADAN